MSTNQVWERWPNVWMSTVLNGGYYYTPPPVCLLLLDNLLGYRGLTTIKPALCLDPTLGAWALGGSSQGLHGLVEVSPSCPALINSPESSVMSGEAGWIVRGAHLHHALGTSQVRASGPDLRLLQGLGSNHISGALGAHLDHPEPRPPQSGAREPEPPQYHCACGIVSHLLI